MQNANGDLENKEIQILYEDDVLLAINKPSGLVVHSDGRTKEPSVIDWLAVRYPELKEVGGLHTLDSGKYIERYGILHRLDRETSGVMLVAKDDATFFEIQRQFIAHTTEKTYLAFVWGACDESGIVDLPIGRNRNDFRQWTTGESARGTLRAASTSWRVLHVAHGLSYVELKPKTGRTHQLRVHMKAIGHPIVCDKRYGSESALGFTRVALHASEIIFLHPIKGQMKIAAPLPPDFEEALNQFP